MVIMDIHQERISERKGEQIDEGLARRVTKENLEAIKNPPQERLSERTGARQVEVPFFRDLKLRGASNDPWRWK